MMNFPQAKVTKWARGIDGYFLDRTEQGIRAEAFNAYLDTIVEILQAIAHKVAPKDDWDMFLIGGGMPEIRSRKLQCGICFDVWLDMKIFMQTPLVYPNRLYRMPDKFWRCLVELNNFGELSFEESVVPKVPSCMKIEMRRNPKSILFRIIRHYMLFASNENDDYTFDGYAPLGDFGQIEVSWPINIQMHDLLTNIYEVFRRFYQLNYLLYRQEYIYNKSIRRKK